MVPLRVWNRKMRARSLVPDGEVILPPPPIEHKTHVTLVRLSPRVNRQRTINTYRMPPVSVRPLYHSLLTLITVWLVSLP